MTSYAQRVQQFFRQPLVLDYQLLGAALILILLGLVIVASATLHRSEAAPYAYVMRHIFSLVLGFVAALTAMLVATRYWQKLSVPLYFLGIVVLLLVLMPGIGHESNGAQRWIYIGSFSLQPSEFMKLFVLLYLASYLARREQEIASTVWGSFKALVFLALAAALVLLQPDLGTAAVIMAMAFALLFLAGVPLWQYAVLIGAGVVAIVSLIVFEPYRMRRVSSFLDPFADQQNSGYQLSNALMAFGRGEWTGVGLGNGVQKLHYLPEAHNDFLLAVIGEELGMLGTVTVILLFTLIAYRALRIGALAEKAGDRFAVYIAYGAGLWLAIQAFFNIAVNLGVMPTKGLTLPLMSFGGNSILVSCAVIGMLLRIYSEVAPRAETTKGGLAWRTSS